MMSYKVLVNTDDYDYYSAAQNNVIYWHDYLYKGFKITAGDTITVIANGYVMDTWEVTQGLEFDNISDAQNNPNVYRFWKQNFQTYYDNSKGVFWELHKINTPTKAVRCFEQFENHSIKKF